MEPFMPYFILAAGLFSALGGAMNWDWFMDNRKARPLVKLFGRGGARAFYIILGTLLASFGGAAAAGLVDMS